MNFTIEIIQHKDHDPRCAGSPGDWRFDNNGDMIIRISNLGDSRMNLLLSLHEFIESAICTERGITPEEVDAFDAESTKDEPGEDKKAPYHREHMFAERLERLMAKELGVSWSKYSQRIKAL